MRDNVICTVVICTVGLLQQPQQPFRRSSRHPKEIAIVGLNDFYQLENQALFLGPKICGGHGIASGVV